MSRSLPPRPAMSHLRKEAKAILRAHRAHDVSILPTLRRLHRFSGAGDAEIFAADLALHDAQFAVAIDYGFASWERLKEHVDAALHARPRTLDYAQVNLRGDGFERDSFCAAVAAGSAILGRPQAYETVLALTLNAFAPSFDLGNDCKELWVGQAWMSHAGTPEAAWDYLGLSADPVPLPARPENSDEPNREFHRACARAIRACMDDDAVILVTGGWQSTEGRWVEPWWAGLVTSVGDDGTVLGAHLNGRLDNPITDFWPGQVLALKLRESGKDLEESAATVLRHAVDKIQARGKRFERKEFAAFGVDAMEEWIRQMEQVAHFCPVCQAKGKPGWRSAKTVAEAMVYRARIAATFLRDQEALLPQSAIAPIQKAATHYDAISRLLAPAMDDQKDHGYRQFVGDLYEQRHHAEQVLRPVRDELLAAANEMERVVALMS